jgi:hypothetical protein
MPNLMAEIYNFNNNGTEEESCCEFCELAREFMHHVKNCKTDEELFETLRGLVGESAKLQLKDYLQKEIQNNAELLDILEYGIEEE